MPSALREEGQKGQDVVDGLLKRTLEPPHQPSPYTSPCPSPKPTTTIGRFQVCQLRPVRSHHTEVLSTLEVLHFVLTHLSLNPPLSPFQVTTNPEARVGRFSVSRAREQSIDSSQTPPPVAQAANGPSDLRQLSIPDSPHKASLLSLNNNSFNNSYFSSDNDSEFEDEDFKREVQRLREKYIISHQIQFNDFEEYYCTFYFPLMFSTLLWCYIHLYFFLLCHLYHLYYLFIIPSVYH